MNKKFILFLLAAANFTHIVDFMIVMPLSDMLMGLFEINPQKYSWVVSAYSWSAFAAGILGAFFLDKFDRRHTFLFVYGGFMLATLACAFAPNFYVLIACRALAGFFGGVVGGLALTIASDLFAEHERGSAVGIIMMAFSVASVVGVPLSLYLADKFTWNAPFVFLATASAGMWILAFFYLPSINYHLKDNEDVLHKPSKLQAFIQILKSQNARLALLMMLVLVAGQFIIIPFITPYMIRNIGFEQEQIKFIYLLGGGATIFSAPFLGRLVDRFGGQTIFKIVLPLSFIAIFLLTQLSTNSVWIALIFTTVFFIFGSGRMVPAQTMLTMAISAKQRASFMSLSEATRQLGAGIASILGGYIVSEAATPTKELINYEWTGYVAIAISGIALFVAPKLKKVKEK